MTGENDAYKGDNSEKEDAEEESPNDESVTIVDNSVNDTSRNDQEHDPYYPPIIVMPELIVVDNGESEENVIFCHRSKMYRYDGQADPPEWKERGTGDVKILEHKKTSQIRLLMRREKTLKICANHHIQPWFQLKHHGESMKSFVWSVQADFSDLTEDGQEESKPAVLAIRFGKEETAALFKEKFEESIKKMTSLAAKKIETENNDDSEKELSEKVGKIDIC